MKSSTYCILLVLLSLFATEVEASHIVGGEFSYKYLGDSVIADTFVLHKYQVSLSIYEDCQNGQPQAIAEDNPAFLTLFNGIGTRLQIDTNVNYDTSIVVPTNFSNSCVTNVPPTCLLKKTFVKTYYLPPNSSGYVVSYQRCCRNNAIINIIDPGNNGSTYFCRIPPSPYVNNSAVFNKYPPQIICLNNPLYYDNSATDADHDSLTYQFCVALEGASSTDIKPIPTMPNQADSVNYTSGYSSQYPMTGFPPIQIDLHTGIITGTPNRIGRYLVTVCCNEWRNGILINVLKREFQFVVTDCSKVVVADIPILSTEPNTYIVDCKNFTVGFENTSKGGFAYHWDFGLPGIVNDTSSDFQPSFTYPDTGTFTVKLIVNPGSTCPDSIERLVKLYPTFKAFFSDSGIQCPGVPINFIDLSSASIKPITNWKWTFGDGDSSFLQNPQHAYKYGGVYNVVLISQNIKDCADTAFRQLVVETFKPFVGNDTVIVKGERVVFNATGGTRYLWTPSAYLNDTTVYDPVGYYTDTGLFTYYVDVQSQFGCIGEDTISVHVVNQAEFFVPSAFSPNGDGINDIFKPVAVGYRDMKYFRVFNRWGEKVFVTTSLETGWDGTYKGKQVDVGVYFWEMEFTDRFGKDAFLKGDVTVVR